MNRSKRGQFYGQTNETIRLAGITLTDTDYSQGRVDWHFHEDDYFTFLLQGGMREGNKKEVYECKAGDLLYHNWQDAHYNIASGQFTRGFHVELEENWYDRFELASDLTQGSIRIGNPEIKTLLYGIFKEAKLSGQRGQLGIDALLVKLFSVLGRMRESADSRKPAWVGRLKEMLLETTTDWTLVELATALNIHPVHLSREFPKHFHTTLGDYVRMIRVQRAMILLPDPGVSLTEIAFETGFADQSHFIRSFRTYYKMTPLVYRRLLSQTGGC
jgi:AraC family transcriptional regulator